MDTAMPRPDILEKLWNGEVDISERCIPVDEECKQILSEIAVSMVLEAVKTNNDMENIITVRCLTMVGHYFLIQH